MKSSAFKKVLRFFQTRRFANSDIERSLEIESLEDRIVLSTATFNLPPGPSGNEVTLVKSGQFVKLMDSNSEDTLFRFFRPNVSEIKIVGQRFDAEKLTIDYQSAGFLDEKIRFDTIEVRDSIRVVGDGGFAKFNIGNHRINVTSGNSSTVISWPLLGFNAEMTDFDHVVYDSREVGGLVTFGPGRLDGRPAMSISGFQNTRLLLNDIDTVSTEFQTGIRGRRVVFNQMNPNIQNLILKGETTPEDYVLNIENLRGLLPTINAKDGFDKLTIRSNVDLTIRALRDNQVVANAIFGGRLVAENFERLFIEDGDGSNHINASKSPLITNIDGGAGNDTIIGSRFSETINGGLGNDDIRGGPGADTIDGGLGSDYIAGQKGNDTIDGNNGNDRIFGGLGNDIIRGGLGNDRINGGLGSDFVAGNGGRDVFLYSGTAANDRITLRYSSNSGQATIQRRNPNSFRILDSDRVRLDPSDRFEMESLQGNDIFDVDFRVPTRGLIDGGSGNDRCSAPADWIIRNCES